MQINITEKQNKDPSLRTLKIKRSFRFNAARLTVDIPEIKLCGKWLARLGFQYNKLVDVTCADEVLSIKQRAD